MLKEVATGRLMDNALYSQKGDKYYFEQAGLKVSDVYQSQNEIIKITYGRDWVNKCCDICEVNDIKEPERKIKISPLAISIFEKYIQKGCGSLEAGGIIIGKENLSNNDLVFVSATEPLKRDIRRKYRFHRKDKGHVTLFNRIYDESRQIHRYIGEWHTHPEKIPNYSGMDLKNWGTDC